MRHRACRAVPLTLAALAFLTSTGLPQLRAYGGSTGKAKMLDAANQPLIFSYNASERSLRDSYTQSGRKQNRANPLEFSSDGGRLEMRLHGQRCELDDGFVPNTQASVTPELVHVLSNGRSLTARVRTNVVCSSHRRGSGGPELVQCCRVTPTG
jgi:hypothetical protein